MDLAISFHQLRLFFLVAQSGGFSRAADILKTSQPSVSLQIRRLENALGVKVFARLGRNVYLTEEGRILLGYARKIMDLMGNLHSDIANLRGLRLGRLSVGASKVPSTTILPLAIALFKKEYTATEIIMKVARSDQVERWLIENEVDLAMIVGDPVSDQLVSEPFSKEDLVLVIPPKHPFIERKAVTARDISKEQLLLPDAGRLKDNVEKAFAEKGVRITNRVIMGSRDAVKTAIGIGFGVSIMSESTVEREAESGFVAVKQIKDLHLKYSINLVYHKDKEFSLLAKAFLSFLRNPANLRRQRRI